MKLRCQTSQNMIFTDAQRALMNSVCHTNHLLIRDSLLENIVLHKDFLCANRFSVTED